jgi:hypothetical protein
MPGYKALPRQFSGTAAEQVRYAEVMLRSGDPREAVRILEATLEVCAHEAPELPGWLCGRLAALYRTVERYDDEVRLLERYRDTQSLEETRARFDARLSKARAIADRKRRPDDRALSSVREVITGHDDGDRAAPVAAPHDELVLSPPVRACTGRGPCAARGRAAHGLHRREGGRPAAGAHRGGPQEHLARHDTSGADGGRGLARAVPRDAHPGAHHVLRDTRVTPPPASFSVHFHRDLAACAQAQVLVSRSVEAATRSRALGASSRQIRLLAVDTREAWRGADLINAMLRRQVVVVAGGMRAAGMSESEAATVVRAHIRFVLYDGGLREVEAEPLVARAATWVEETYRAA